MSAAVIAGLGALCVLACALQGAIGIGSALVLAPALQAAMPAGRAVAVSLLLGALLCSLVLVGERRPVRPAARELWPLWAAAPAGQFAVVLALGDPGGRVLQALVGAALLVAAAAVWRVPGPAAAGGSAGLDAGVGAGVGALTALTGINGPFIAVHLAARHPGGSPLRDRLTATLLWLDLAALAALAVVRPDDVSSALAPSLLLVPAVVAGWALGRRAFLRTEAGRHRGLVLAAVAVGALGTLLGALL